MPSSFGDIFTYAGPGGPDIIFNSIANCQNSMDCHTALLELFMNALKLSGKQYRSGAFEPDPAITAIPDEASLNYLLNLIPEDLQYPVSQVMYEQYTAPTDPGTIGNNACYIRTFNDPAAQAALQSAVDAVRAFHYAYQYNALHGVYAALPWAAGIPAAIAITNPQDPPAKVDVTSAINDLQTWISAHDPQIVALNTLHSKTIAGDILTDVFGAVPVANVSTDLFTTALIRQIKKEGTEKVTTEEWSANRVFFNDVQTDLQDVTTIWHTNPTLKILAGRINAKSPVAILQNHSQVVATFDQISELFGLALSDATTAAAARNRIGMILDAFDGHTTSNPDYLLLRLQSACVSMAETLNPDPQTLAAWIDEINLPLPTTIDYSEIDGLMELVVDQLLQIPVTFRNTNVSPFAFTNFDTIAPKLSGNVFSPGGSAHNSDDILVAADAKENGTVYSRPIFGVFTINNAGIHETYLKYFNIDGIQDGTFYFSYPDDPQRVQQDYFQDPAPEDSLTFNFSDATINNSKVVPAGGAAGYLAGVAYRTFNGNSTSNIVFYNVIKNVSKWTSLNGRLQYDILYETNYAAPDNIGMKTHLIWYLSSGDLNRTDKIDNDWCLWHWLAPDDVKERLPQIPELLGLPAERNIENFSGRIETCIRPSDNGYSSAVQYAILDESGGSEIYVLTNTPGSNLPKTIDDVLGRESRSDTSSTPLAEQSRAILFVLNFHYYRKIDTETGTVIKCLPANHRPASPADGTDVSASYPNRPPECQQVLAINNPLSFRLSHNISFFKHITNTDAPAGVKLLNKGNNLYRAGGKRLAAGSVMAKLRNYINTPPDAPGTNSSLPASAMSNWELSQSTDARQAWQLLIQSDRDVMPTDQEWCHLLGHGDGGDERLGNFASGSFHCNTEQLAMESKNRRKITQLAAKGAYSLRSTAYLFNDGAALLNGNYLSSDSAYNKMKSLYSTLNKPRAVPPPAGKAGSVMPFAALFRYKMYRYMADPDAGGAVTRAQFVKLFDHIFAGQSEFMDLHQFNILKHAAWFCLAGQYAFSTWYVDQTEADMEIEIGA